MESLLYMYLLGIVLGFVLGSNVFKLLLSKKPVGSLYAYKSDGQTYLYLELFEEIDNVCNEKQVVLKVNKSFLTQK